MVKEILGAKSSVKFKIDGQFFDSGRRSKYRVYDGDTPLII